MSRPGVIGRFWANFTRTLGARKTLERRVVGYDRYGNTFYVASGDREDKATNRGYIPGNKEIGQWHKVHPLWDEWLRKRRDTTPSEEEMKVYDAATERRREFIKQVDAREKAQQLAASDMDEMTVRDMDSARRTAKELKPKIGVTQDISAGGLQKPKTYPQPEEYESEAGVKEYEKERKNMFSDK